jgi:hypothetical protein
MKNEAIYHKTKNEYLYLPTLNSFEVKFFQCFLQNDYVQYFMCLCKQWVKGGAGYWTFVVFGIGSIGSISPPYSLRPSLSSLIPEHSCPILCNTVTIFSGSSNYI